MSRSLRTVLAAVVFVLPLALPGAVSAADDLGSFGTPTASSTFQGGITFSQPVTVSAALRRAELLITAADAAGPTVIAVPAPGVGATTLTHHLDTSQDAHVYPNTPIVARWRLVAADDPSHVQLGPEVRITFSDDRFTWKTVTGDIVRVHWYEGSQAFAERALKIGDDSVKATAALLGVSESKPIDFYIYADQTSFYDVLGAGSRENVGGEAHPEIRTLFALIPPAQIDDAWVGQVVPHELTHIVFDTASGNPYHSPPHWLNEGLAVYQAQGYDPGSRQEVQSAAADGTLMPLDGLIGAFPTTYERFSLGYAESVSAVDFLVRIYGKDALVTLIRSYADGRTDDEAFTAAVGVDLAGFDQAWLKDVKAKPASVYGPKPAAAGPVPSAWTATSSGAPAPTAPAAASGAPSAAAAPSSQPIPSEGSGSGSSAVVLVAVIVVAVVLIGALAVARRRRMQGEGGP